MLILGLLVSKEQLEHVLPQTSTSVTKGTKNTSSDISLGLSVEQLNLSHFQWFEGYRIHVEHCCSVPDLLFVV